MLPKCTKKRPLQSEKINEMLTTWAKTRPFNRGKQICTKMGKILGQNRAKNKPVYWDKYVLKCNLPQSVKKGQKTG